MLSTTEFKKICTHKHQPYLFVPLSSSSFKVWQECSYNTLVEKNIKRQKEQDLKWWVHMDMKDNARLIHAQIQSK